MCKENDFFLDKGVVIRCREPLYERFKVLLLKKKCTQQKLADYCSTDKANMSRIVHGKIDPPLRIKLKIAEFFGVDTSLIWQNGLCN